MIWSLSEERPESWDMRGKCKLLEDTLWSSLWCTVTSTLLAGSQDELTLWSHNSHSSFTEQRTLHISRAEDEALPGVSRLLIYILSHSFHAIHSLPVHLLFFLLADVVDWSTAKTWRIIQIISLRYIMYRPDHYPYTHLYCIEQCIADLYVKVKSYSVS